MLLECKKKFYRAANFIFGKIGRTASEEVILKLISSKFIPVLFYGLESLPLYKYQLNWGVWKCKYGKSKYKCAKMESASTEKWSTIELGWKMQVQAVKHINSPIILNSYHHFL